MNQCAHLIYILTTENTSRYCIENHNYTLILFQFNFHKSFDKSYFSNINSNFSTFGI
jgi:hypothetical protein